MTQIPMFIVREIEPGEHPRCVDCSKTDSITGQYGPPMLDEIEFMGDVAPIDTRSLWFCRGCGDKRWREWQRRRSLLPKRLERLRAFRAAGRLGLTQGQTFALAERWLREGCVPIDIDEDIAA